MADTIQNNATPLFVGTFCHSIDGKNRITIPSDWRFQEGVELFLVPSTSAKCLVVMPRWELDRIRAEARGMQGAQRMALLRRVGADSRRTTLDKHGRLSLPAEFCEQFNLSGDVTMSGAVDTFEIWNTAHWNATRSGQHAVSDPLLPEFGL